MNPQRAQPDEPGDVEQRQSTKPKRLSWSDYIEEQIRSAQERGEFRNLEGHGKPLQLDENPWAGERAMAYRLLKANNVAPPEIEAGRAVDDDLARAESALATLRRRRDDLLGRRAAFPSERRAYEILRSKTEMRYAEALRAANSKILSLNIIAPAALHRRVIDVEARLRAFHEEFPAATVAEGGA